MEIRLLVTIVRRNDIVSMNVTLRLIEKLLLKGNKPMVKLEDIM